MRVLHVYKDYHPVMGGIENHLRLLTQGLSQVAGMEVDVLVTNSGPRTVVEQHGHVRVTKAGRLANIASAPISLALLQEIGRRSYDIIHLHFPYPVGEMAALGWGRTRRLVITYHSDVVRQQFILRFYHPFLLKLLSRADAIIAGSPDYIESSPYLTQFRDKCTVIPFGIDLSYFQSRALPEVSAGLRARFKPPYILFVGKFRYYKGIHYLLEAMKDVKDCTLLLVGAGPEEASLRAQARRLGMESRVAFLGQVAESLLPSYYQSSQLFVLPSCLRAEAFGLVQVEAMACGLPVVSTQLGTGTSFVNQHGVTGLVVPPADPAALSAALNLILGDHQLRHKLGQAARRRVAEEFTAERMVQAVLDLYGRLL
ncbi:MAG: glycosyltransferase [Dehalococcoidia bacterium]|nr:glycosyltransferase [Dehalococcoidia bacterium]